MPPSPHRPPVADTAVSEPAEAPSVDVRALSAGRNWNGYLTVDNTTAVADRLRAMFTGRGFSVVCCNEGMRDWFPEVRPSQTAGQIEACTEPFEGKPAGSILFSHGAYLSDWSTQIVDQDAARTIPPEDRPPYFRFNRDQVEVTDRVPAGFWVYQVFAVEDHS